MNPMAIVNQAWINGVNESENQIFFSIVTLNWITAFKFAPVTAVFAVSENVTNSVLFNVQFEWIQKKMLWLSLKPSEMKPDLNFSAVPVFSN